MDKKIFNVNLSIHDLNIINGIQNVGKCQMKISENIFNEKTLYFKGNKLFNFISFICILHILHILHILFYIFYKVFLHFNKMKRMCNTNLSV